MYLMTNMIQIVSKNSTDEKVLSMMPEHSENFAEGADSRVSGLICKIVHSSSQRGSWGRGFKTGTHLF